MRKVGGASSAGHGSMEGEATGEAAGEALDPLALDESWADTDGPLEDETGDEVEAHAQASQARWGWLAPVLAGLAIAGWSGWFVWANIGALGTGEGVTPAQATRWLIDWSIPVALIGIVSLLAMRTSRAEASRYAAVAAAMRRESAALEARLITVNRELSLAREFLAAQARDMEALGRIAAERISAHAFELQSLIASNGAQVEAIGSASETALGNMNRLRGDLPVIANAARDVANQVGGAGRMAQEQLDGLVASFERLGAVGARSDSQISALTDRVAEALDRFEAQSGEIDAALGARLARLKDETETQRAALAAQETAALEAMQSQLGELESGLNAMGQRLDAGSSAVLAGLADGIARLDAALADKIEQAERLDRAAAAAVQQRIADLAAEAGRFDDRMAERDRVFHEDIERRQAAFETREAQASEVLAQRLAELDDNLARRREAQMAENERLVTQSEALAERLDALRQMLSDVAEHGEQARTSLAAGLGDLGSALADKRNVLAEVEGQLAKLTEASGQLAEAVEAGARTSRQEWPAAIAAATAQLDAAGARAGEIEAFMLSAEAKGSDLSAQLAAARGEVEATDGALARLHQQLTERAASASDNLAGLRAEAERLTSASAALADGTQQQLAGAVTGLERAVAAALAALDAGLREAASTAASSIGSQAAQTLEQALRSEAAGILGEFALAATKASETGRETTRQLRDQLGRVNELAGNLEQRVARARELAEDQVNNDFSRRAALITDSLNSAAIDITTALETEVTDTAWDAYLKGDRGIFTRRVVRLIDNGTARDIVELYQQDDGFKANVNRYVHDFEAMLRTVLSTRDGHALSITMLGSDLGKLYVALAQAIQRLRS